MQPSNAIFLLGIVTTGFLYACSSDNETPLQPGTTAGAGAGGAAGSSAATGGKGGTGGKAGTGGAGGSLAGTAGQSTGGTGGSGGESGASLGGEGGMGGEGGDGQAGQGGDPGTGGTAGVATGGTAGAATGGAGAGTSGTSGNGGVGGSAPTCQGTATPCVELTLIGCALADGCDPMEACTGTPPACATLVTQQVCNGISGCDWNGQDQVCEGTADACNTHAQSSQCTMNGCTWSVCGGTAVECSSLDGIACALQPGCSIN